ncbi:hypothetical protein LguiA_006331 [Lonicera macranthoides]
MGGLMKRGAIIWLMMVMPVMLTLAAGREPHLHKVGGTKGWTQNVNYTEWSLHERFYVGDWLYFVFDKHSYTVLEVNKTNYEMCRELNFIKNITKGGRDVFNLTDARPFYFISGGGYCYHGMKLAINVTDFVPAPAPSQAQNASWSSSGSQGEPHALLLILTFSLVTVM